MNNTETFILHKHLDFDIKELKISELNQNEKSCIEFYIEITRHIQEIHQLFGINYAYIENYLEIE